MQRIYIRHGQKSDGSQTRSFQYIDDLLEGMIRFMNTDDSITGPVNIGNENEFTIRELAELVLELTGSSSEIHHLPLPENDPAQRKQDIRYAKELLNLEAMVQLREGLEKTIAYFKSTTGSGKL